MDQALTQEQEQAILAQVEHDTKVFREGMLHLLVGRTRDYTQSEGEQFDAEAQALLGRLKAIIEETSTTDGKLMLAAPISATASLTLNLMTYLIAQCREAGDLPEDMNGLTVRRIHN